MTGDTDAVRKFLNAFNTGNVGELNAILDDRLEFQVAGVPATFGKQDLIGMVQRLRTAFPDWSFANVNFKTETSPVKATIDTSGTHKGPLDLSAMGGGTVPPTGKTFKHSQEPATWVVENGRITRHTVDSPTGGVMGMLSQLGIEMPGPRTN